MARHKELRLMAKVASLYYRRKLCQTEIAAQLDVSQATVSRLQHERNAEIRAR